MRDERLDYEFFHNIQSSHFEQREKSHIKCYAMYLGHKLLRPFFIIAVLLLLINDLYFKYEYHNAITGKLSDFAGLFAFPYFLSCFFPNKAKSLYIVTVVFFILWKSTVSQPIFDFAHTYGIGFNRTVDYSDLIALAILPFSYKYWNTNFKPRLKSSYFLRFVVIGLCSFSFIATSVPEHRKKLSLKSNFSINVLESHESVIKKLNPYDYFLEDKTYYYRMPIPRERTHITTLISIKTNSVDSVNTTIAIDSILSYTIQGNAFIFSSGIKKKDVEYMENLSQEEIETLFSQQMMELFPE